MTHKNMERTRGGYRRCVNERACGWNKLDEGSRDGARVKETKHKVHCTAGELEGIQVLEESVGFYN